MRKILLLPVVWVIGLQAMAGVKDSTVYFNLPDSVKAVQFMAEIKVETQDEKKYCEAEISVGVASLSFWADRKNRVINFHCLSSEIAETGFNVRRLMGPAARKGMGFSYNWKYNVSYRLLIALAADFATGITLYSGYVWFPEESKWKLIGTFRVGSYNPSLMNLSTHLSYAKRSMAKLTANQAWAQRSNGSWKNLKEENTPPPVINLYSHVDSLAQRNIEIKQIQDSIATGKASNLNQHNGIYYSMMKEGSGRQVAVTDTVVAYYKGYLFANGQVFDQTKDKPATFPLSRLIKGWQIGLPLCKVGGKIRLVIPSDLGYSIRTRAAKIPPNSILVFEIEVVDVKPLR